MRPPSRPRSFPSVGALPGAILLSLLASPAHARPAPYTIEQLAPGVHAVVRQTPPGGVSDSNVLIIVNDSDVVVVDANILPSSARQMVAEIRKLTPLPVRYVINTHWHSDHHYGNAVYREAWPGVEFVQHPRTRQAILEQDIPSLQKNLESEYPALVERIERTLATGVRSNGEPLKDEDRPRALETLDVYKSFLAEMKEHRPIPGTLTTERLVLERGERSIVVEFLGRGNTAGDLVVHLPREGIVATGDLVVHPIPFAFFASLAEWPGTLGQLRRTGAAIVVPGHGAVQRDWTYVDRLAALIESTWEQTRRAVAAGKDLEATIASVDLDAFLPAFGGEAQRGVFDYLYRRPAVEAAVKDLQAAAAPAPPGGE